MIYLDKESDFIKEVQNGKVLVDFYADWCGPCQMLGKELEEYEKSNKNIKVLKVNTDKFEQLAINFGITSIPHVVLFESGKIKNVKTGYMDKATIEKFVEK